MNEMKLEIETHLGSLLQPLPLEYFTRERIARSGKGVDLFHCDGLLR